MSKTSREVKSDEQIFTRFLLIVYFFFVWLVAILVANVFVSLGFNNFRVAAIVIILGFSFFVPFLLATIVSLKNFKRNEVVIYSAFTYKLYRITDFLYSSKIQAEIFKPIVADWEQEYFEALSKQEIKKARWINARYTYAFLASMWMKSPFGDLIEFIKKIAT